MRTALVVVVGVALALAACKPAPQGPTPEQLAAEKVSQALQAGGDDGGAPAPPVEVTAEGSRFEPPVRLDQIPSGAWYCDMGTVHYARLEEGDGRCPVCGMKLTHR